MGEASPWCRYSTNLHRSVVIMVNDALESSNFNPRYRMTCKCWFAWAFANQPWKVQGAQLMTYIHNLYKSENQMFNFCGLEALFRLNILYLWESIIILICQIDDENTKYVSGSKITCAMYLNLNLEFRVFDEYIWWMCFLIRSPLIQSTQTRSMS